MWRYTRSNQHLVIQELGLSFTTAVELPTGCSEVELIPGGAQVDVTKERPKSFERARCWAVGKQRPLWTYGRLRSYPLVISFE